jgi:cell division protein FtsL
MIKKISALLLIIICVFCLTGCNNETEEERLQREIRESEQRVREAQKEYNDTQKAVNEYNKYRNAVENAK